MLKNIISVVAGYVLWATIFLIGGVAIRAALPAVHDEKGITSDVGTLVIYLVVSIIASLAAGFLTAKLANNSQTLYAGILAVCLLATGIPVQLSAWDVLPVWYNLAFLIMLVPVTMLGASLVSSKADPVKHAAA